MMKSATRVVRSCVFIAWSPCVIASEQQLDLLTGDGSDNCSTCNGREQVGFVDMVHDNNNMPVYKRSSSSQSEYGSVTTESSSSVSCSPPDCNSLREFHPSDHAAGWARATTTTTTPHTDVAKQCNKAAQTQTQQQTDLQAPLPELTESSRPIKVTISIEKIPAVAGHESSWGISVKGNSSPELVISPNTANPALWKYSDGGYYISHVEGDALYSFKNLQQKLPSQSDSTEITIRETKFHFYRKKLLDAAEDYVQAIADDLVTKVHEKNLWTAQKHYFAVLKDKNYKDDFRSKNKEKIRRNEKKQKVIDGELTTLNEQAKERAGRSGIPEKSLVKFSFVAAAQFAYWDRHKEHEGQKRLDQLQQAIDALDQPGPCDGSGMVGKHSRRSFFSRWKQHHQDGNGTGDFWENWGSASSSVKGDDASSVGSYSEMDDGFNNSQRSSGATTSTTITITAPDARKSCSGLASVFSGKSMPSPLSRSSAPANSEDSHESILNKFAFRKGKKYLSGNANLSKALLDDN